MKQNIVDNYKCVQDCLAAACARARREPQEVRLIAVSKMADVEDVKTLLELGQCHFGEAKVQDLLTRMEELAPYFQERDKTGSAVVRPLWHMIGHLQRNKVKALLPIAEMIHSVDSLRLAEEINTMAARLGLAEKVQIMLEVNTSQERQKFGLAVGAVMPMADLIQTLPNLQVAGLMTMAPLTENEDEARFCFGRLREVFEEIRSRKICGPSFRHLSMGMSRDYEIAIEEGATMVRIGTALFS